MTTMTPNIQSTWEEYIQHVKFWRNEVKRSVGESISRLELVPNAEGRPTIYGLATAPGDSASSQMIMYAQIPLDSPLPTNEAEERPMLELKPLVDVPELLIAPKSPISEQSQGKAPPAELALHAERMRGQIVSGVTAYSMHPASGAFLISTSTQLVIFKNKQLKPIAQWLPQSSPVLNATFCQIDPEYVAFNSGNQLFIDKNNVEMFASNDSQPHISNGVAAFVTQEEFERYEGYWWSPTRVELLYERVDESVVTKLAFTLPGAKADEQPMRYPLAGTPNATSEPRICRLDEQSGQFVDLALDSTLQSALVSSMEIEYIVRMGWTSDGNDVFALVMNRGQTQMAILLIPRTLFAQKPGQGVGQIRCVYMENAPQVWINANNLLHFLPQQKFIFGSECTDKCHLQLHSITANDDDDQQQTQSQPITASQDWAVLKEAILKVDLNRRLVFFLANRHSPILLSLCVSAFGDEQQNEVADCRVLTPNDLSYKFERADPSLYLNPDIGFVCWLSAVDKLPECRFYRLIHCPDDRLPHAVFTHRVGVQVLSPSSGIANTSSWGLPYLHRNPSSIFNHRFIQFQSQNSGQTHYALMLWPTTSANENEAKFPVIQAVYAGPSIQLVKNSWQTISQYLKFVSFGYAVVIVDGRGSANRGIKFESAIKERMGSVEIEDQMEGLQIVAQQEGGQILDLNRVAVIGWSYGGYASLQLLADYPNIYRAACVGGAVTDWQLYDTAYTERYMGMPQQNADAYKESAALSKIAKLPNQEGRLLIVHGMIDENVHFQHTVKLINALMGAQKPHQLLLFPGERHAIRNGESIEHFHATILSFFGRALSYNNKKIKDE